LKLQLEKYKWYQKDNIHVTGYIFDGTGYLINSRLAGYFDNMSSLDLFREKLLSSNGQFSVVINKENKTWIACDKLRNYPIFYTFENNELMVSDNP
jgi:asparagine synthase (glutamine-hydrolysing)